MLNTPDLPVLFLDVDGVIAPYWPGQRDMPHRPVRAGGQDIMVIPDVIAAIHELSRSGLCDIRWLTSWQASAAVELAPELNLDHFYAYTSDEALDWPEAVDEWKEEVVTDWADTNPGQFIWIDDMLAHTRAGDRLEARHPGRGRFVSPDGNFGLTLSDIAELTERLTRLAA